MKKKSFRKIQETRLVEEEPKIFSLDISQERTGWAFLHGSLVMGCGNIKRSDYFDKDAVTFNSPEFGNMLASYSKVVWDVFEQCIHNYGEPDYFVVEDLNIRYIKAAKSLLQFQAAAKIAISQATSGSTDIYMINNQTVKAFMGVRTLKSNMLPRIKELAKLFKQKEVKILMVDEVNRKYPFLSLRYEQNDEADAIAQALTFYKKVIIAGKDKEE